MQILLLHWRDAFIFATVIAILTFILRIASLHGQINLPLTLSVALSLAIQLALGGWFFSHRGLTRNGQPLGWPDAIQLCAIAFAFVTLTSFLVNVIVRILSTIASH